MNEIFRPPGLYLITDSLIGRLQKLPLSGLGIGQATFSFNHVELSSIHKSIDFSTIDALGIEVHGLFLNIPGVLKFDSSGVGSFYWDDFSFNFTLFSLWVEGLNLNQKEDLISDILSWQKKAREISIHQEAALFDRKVKKVA